jgi:hypothetical protein
MTGKLLPPENVPEDLKHWMEFCYPNDEWKEWYVEHNDVYKEYTPQECLSVTDEIVLYENIKKMLLGFHDAMSFLGICDFIKSTSVDDIYKEILEYQVNNQ